MLTNQYNFSPDAKTVTQVVANLGAISGGKCEITQGLFAVAYHVARDHDWIRYAA